jgi:CheY-like chemotaxis protein
MRFRFGWRKEQKRDKNPIEILAEDDQSEALEDLSPANSDPDSSSILNGQSDQEVTMPAQATRILVFGDHEELGSLCTLYLRSKGYEVFHFPSPTACALIAQQNCTCPRDHVCADILITEMDMEGMTGLDLIRHQRDRGCRALPGNKAVISTSFNKKQESEATSLGCKTLLKPFRLLDMMEWVNKCEMNITPDRKLIPQEELLETVQV